MSIQHLLYIKPVWDEIDLLVDGTLPRELLFKETFSTVERVILGLEFSGTTQNWQRFGGGSPLVNGFDLIYEGLIVNPKRIKKNKDLAKYGFDADFKLVTSTLSNNLLIAKWSFFKYMPNGLPMWHNERLGIRIHDDMTQLSTIKRFWIVAQGWKGQK